MIHITNVGHWSVINDYVQWAQSCWFFINIEVKKDSHILRNSDYLVKKIFISILNTALANENN